MACEPRHARWCLTCIPIILPKFFLPKQGTGTDVAVSFEAIDGRPPAPGEAEGCEPLWFGQVVPGAQASRVVTVHNRSLLPMPYSWHLRRLPAAARSAPSTQGSCSSTSNAHTQPLAAVSSCPQAASAEAAASTEHCCWVVTPARGELPPQQAVRFTCSFQPGAVQALAAQAQLHVGPTARLGGPAAPGTAPPPLCSLQLAGQGTECALEVSPSALVLPGALVVGETVVRRISVSNLCAAPAQFSFQPRTTESGSNSGASSGCAAGDSAACVRVEPACGTVPPYGIVHADVHIRALHAGPGRQRLLYDVQHGQPQPLLVTWRAEEPAIEVEGPAHIDLGMFKAGGQATHVLVIANSCAAAAASYALRVLPSAQQVSAALRLTGLAAAV